MSSPHASIEPEGIFDGIRWGCVVLLPAGLPADRHPRRGGS
jgi:hypothetical protein